MLLFCRLHFKEETEMRNYLTDAEVRLLLRAAHKTGHSERNRCLIYMCFIHGFRVSEICRLRLSDIDINTGNIFISRLKNGFSTIHPMLSDEVMMLNLWMDVRRTYTCVKAECEDYVFLTSKGRPLTRHAVYKMLKKAGEDAGLSVRVHPHMLRHACGYALADRRIDTRLIQDYLGHTNITHTVRYTASNPLRFMGIWHEPAASWVTK
ncbi:tyrosine-type DNA invertase [Morganella morganii]|uniref:tyrosine-type DNA invertase n=1 Tax=Morganella morganii TaxID=582 RepID=UPI002367C685|nr:tyrosine-type DNA invertase [Morganella morganii]